MSPLQPAPRPTPGRLHPARILLAAVLASAIALACADSGDGGGSPAAPATGRVAVVLTDAPVHDFVQALVTVSRIELLPATGGGRGDQGPGRQTLFEGLETFDLLALEHVSEPFAIAEDVPVGTYTGLRLRVEDIELVRLNDDGSTSSVFPRLPSGRIDLNPRGGFEVLPGATLALRLDIDARRSIQVVQTGNGRTIFRPVVFVEVLDATDPGRLITVEGRVDAIDTSVEPAHLRLCEVAIAFRDRRERRDESCLGVFVDGETAIFADSGRPADLDGIDLGETVAVFGRFVHDDDRRFALEAEVVELGGSAAFLALTGTISGAFDEASGTIVVQLDPGQGFVEGTSVEVLLVPETGLFDSLGERVALGDLGVGAVVELDGVVELSGTLPDLVRAAIVFVRSPTPPGDL
ncbi:MAG: DUF4382 domain-containing protein [Spirochaetaceae bacterium]|nr:DUF4382 domain-containing protein [Spirochaetaceae bacterium]